MKQRTTLLIGMGKTVNLITVFIIIIWGISFLPFHPAVTGGLAYTSGEMVETILIWYQSKKKKTSLQELTDSNTLNSN